MVATVSGTVTDISARSTRVGDMYDVTVNGVKYGNGKYAPRGVKVGDFVTFDAETKVNGQYTNYNIVPKTLRVDDKPAPAAVAASAKAAAVVVAATDKRQETISKQANLNTALTLVGLQLQHGALKLPAKAADANEALNAVVSATAARLYEATTGDTWDFDLNAEAEVSKTPVNADVIDGEYDA